MKKRLSRRTRLAVVIGGLALFACIGYLSIGYYIYLQLATGSQGHGDNKNNTPADFHLDWGERKPFDLTEYICPNYQDVVIPGGDEGIDLAAWWVLGKPGAPAVIMCHGIHSSKANSTLLLVAGMLNKNGYNLVLFDYRDHGFSTQEDGMISLGVREYRDIIAVFDWLIQHKKIPAHRIGLYGSSMGGGYVAVAFMMDQRIPAVIMESPYANLKMIIEEELGRNGFPTWLSGGAVLTAKWHSGDDVLSMPPLSAVVRSNGRPMLAIHSLSDKRVGVHHTQMMVQEAERAKANLTSWIMDEVEHFEAPIAYPSKYEKRIVSFYQKALN